MTWSKRSPHLCPLQAERVSNVPPSRSRGAFSRLGRRRRGRLRSSCCGRRGRKNDRCRNFGPIGTTSLARASRMVRHICTCGQVGHPRIRQMSPCRIRIDPSSSYALLSMSILAALRIRSRFFETDCIGSDAEARNLFLRTSIEILHSTRFPPTRAAIVATLVIGFQDSSRGNEISLSSVF